MGTLEIPGMIALTVILAVPVSILVAGIAFTAHLARTGAPATLARAPRRRELRAQRRS